MKNQAMFRNNEEFIQFAHILQTTDGVVENFDESEKLIIHEKPRSKFTFSCNFATLTRTSGNQYDVRKSSKRKFDFWYCIRLFIKGWFFIYPLFHS